MNDTKMINARIEKQLLKVASFSCGEMTYKDLFKNHVVRVTFVKTDNMDKYNRIKFNRMDNNKEQDDYINRLKKEVKKYRAYFDNDTFININKLLFEGFKMLNNGRTLRL